MTGSTATSKSLLQFRGGRVLYCFGDRIRGGTPGQKTLDRVYNHAGEGGRQILVVVKLIIFGFVDVSLDLLQERVGYGHFRAFHYRQPHSSCGNNLLVLDAGYILEEV